MLHTGGKLPAGMGDSMRAMHRGLPPQVVTRLLRDVVSGSAGAEERLWQLVFPICLDIATQTLARDRLSRLLHPRELVNLAYLKLTGSRMPPCPDRSSFFGLAARAMRQAMVDTARSIVAGGPSSLGEVAEHSVTDRRREGGDWRPEDLLSLEAALVELARETPRRARILELRFFSNLKVHEIARIVGVCRRTATQELHDGLVWLTHRLGS